jgi:hypothetical protein
VRSTIIYLTKVVHIDILNLFDEGFNRFLKILALLEYFIELFYAKLGHPIENIIEKILLRDPSFVSQVKCAPITPDVQLRNDNSLQWVHSQ